MVRATAGPRSPVGVALERRNGASRERLMRRVQREFEEMPGLRLTQLQAARLFGLEQETCNRVLAAFIRSGFLRLTRNGLYARNDLAA